MDYKNFLDRIFWNSYATAYDDIAKYYNPYKALMAEIIGFIKKKLHSGKIFDAGCGTGELSARLSEERYKIDALDVSEVMLEKFSEKIRNRKLKNIKIFKGDLNKKLPFKNGRFNLVINVHSLFMLDNKWFTLDELTRVLKKGGYLIIAHHKPIKISVIFAAVLREEGPVKLVITAIRLMKVAFFNLIAGQIHRKVYGHIQADKIICYMKDKGTKLLIDKKMYNGFDDFLVFKK
jgi:ubiquinone/menaquinone biosynthesis C-methylase UbiE